MTTFPSLATTPDVHKLLTSRAPVAIGVSGGKDSDAVAFATNEYLDRIGHSGPRLLIHSDLGRVEWKASLPQCERLAARLGLELAVVRRASGDMMDRWLTRWAGNLDRYASLKCVKLILPWSTASMRFCTSELKTAIICRELVRRFPDQTIVNVTGIRREESANRAKTPIVKPNNKLTSKTRNTLGVDWLPILNWTLDDVIGLHHARNFPLHVAYQTNTRVSCAFCIMGSQADLHASTTWPEHHELYHEMVGLEADSTFAFQDSGWLADVAPHLLSAAELAAVADAKQRAAERIAIESAIPDHLLYENGWPKCMPSRAEARMLADVRSKVAGLFNISASFLDADSIVDRYAELINLKNQRKAA